MKIEDDELDSIEQYYDSLEASYMYGGPRYERRLLAALKEAQELIEKFDLSWVVDAEGEIGGCIYCHICLIKDDCILCQSLDGAHRPDCPYAIRERLGYGQKETKDG